MCGIAGYISIEGDGELKFLEKAVNALASRGPDFRKAEILSPHVGFAHARLSIIDTSSVANQPMTDGSGRYTIIFNGEIFNYKQLRDHHLGDVKLTSSSDTEVLLNLYIRYGHEALNLLNGFFAFAIYDRKTEEVFLARDRYGIKPLYIYQDETRILFASETKALLQFPVKRQIDFDTLSLYLQLNYIPGELSMFKNINKLKPGCYAIIKAYRTIDVHQYYSIPYTPGQRVDEAGFNYANETQKLKEIITSAVQDRLVSDVPLGCFLSGGVDSSVVAWSASRSVNKLKTYSIGFSDNPYFDETHYAKKVAEKCGTEHTVFSMTSDEMLNNIFKVLDYIDEPFADSSGLALHLLCFYTRKQVTVALSGDGSDELFGGYNKHRAELWARKSGLFNIILKAIHPITSGMNSSRSSGISNVVRQINRYVEAISKTPGERYWQWCSLTSATEVEKLLCETVKVDENKVEAIRNNFIRYVKSEGDLNDVLFADTQLVLPGDMLTKVDTMSMANRLEVRVPFLDYRLVNYAFTLPASFKISTDSGKKILKDAFRGELPDEIFTRKKQGFEVPLRKWMQTGLKSLICDELMSNKFIEEQGIFNAVEIGRLTQRLFSSNPGDAHATVWSILVFQYWYKKYFTTHA